MSASDDLSLHPSIRCAKGFFEEADQSLIIEIIGANSRAQNVLATTLLRRVPRIASDRLR